MNCVIVLGGLKVRESLDETALLVVDPLENFWKWSGKFGVEFGEAGDSIDDVEEKADGDEKDEVGQGEWRDAGYE